MSWVTNKAEIVSVMPSGYKEVPNGLTLEEAPKTYNHKVYEIRLGEPDITEISSNADITSDLVILRVKYRNDGMNTYDSNKDLFNAVYDAVKTLGKFLGLESYSYTRSEDDKYTSIGQLEFYYDYRSC